MRNVRVVLLVSLFMALTCLLALPAAQAAPTPPPATMPAVDQPTPAQAFWEQATSGPAEVEYPPDWFAPIKKPTNWFEWGGDLRLREQYEVNDRSLNKNTPGHNIHLQRYRTRLFSTLTPVNNDEAGKIDFNVRLTWEFFNFCYPQGVRDTNFDEVVFDSLNIKWSKILNSNLSATVGRQDITDLGNGWLIFDGTPLDGSRTVYFDAVRATYDMPDAKTKLDLIGVANSAESQWLPPINDQDKFLNESDVAGVIAWLTNKSIDRTELNAFYIFTDDTPQLATGLDQTLHTFGGRVVHDFDDHWRARAEVAEQLGHRDFVDVCAGAFNSRLTYFFKDSWNQQLHLDYEYLSGDDPSTDTNEGFDILWGRWPQWSEIAANVWALEGGRPAAYTNLQRVGGGWVGEPLPQRCRNTHGETCAAYAPLQVSLDYYLLFANENTFAGSQSFSDSGHFRGQLVTAWLRYRFNEHVSGHLIGEVFFPGDYYSDFRNDVGVFARYELQFQW